MSDLPLRSRKILFAVITEFIASGDAVGSRTLAKKYGLDLSAASIRNVLSDLEEDGYLRQPHTSAGRVPTDQALRFFIDTLMDVRKIAPEDRTKMGARFAEIYASAEDPLRETGKYLSELAGAAAVIAGPKRELRSLAQLRFIPTKPGQLLAVLVFTDGSVENRFVSIESPNERNSSGAPTRASAGAGVISESELTRIHNLLADVIEGRTLGEVRDIFARRLAEDRIAIDALRRRAFELGSRAIPDVSSRDEVVIEGQARLIDLPEYTDVGRLKKVVLALDERAELLGLLERTIAAGAVTVFVGSEAGDLGGGELSLVVAPYSDHGRVAGTVGVLGPTRMDYAKVMPLVDATANALTEAFGRSSR